jgi:L-seryl-tRNA(Ser) seleniumtransferase
MNLQGLPSVEHLLQTLPATELIASYGRPLTLQAIRSTLEAVRTRASRNSHLALPDSENLLSETAHRLEAWTSPSLAHVINATGVILHTNLGRAPLSSAALQAIQSVSQGYSNLEFDLETGKRGSRLVHAEALLQRLVGAEAAMVVNNNAAAVLLVLAALANRRRVVIARTQLVEIGGGFRVPDVMKQSGARLVEVGSTNKVWLADYEEALEEPVALILHAHRSNFKLIGFTEEPELKDIAHLAHSRGVLCVDDLGSGALLGTDRYGLAHEPTIQESLAAGMDLVCFSGDKLLGGPQAGVIIGKAGIIAKIKKHPLARAVRADKLCLAALNATLLHYLKDEAESAIPIWRMMALAPEQLRQTAEAWRVNLGQGEVIPGESAIGGGSLPGENLPTFLLALDVTGPDKFLEALRHQHPPILARTENDRILFDPRTVLPEEEASLLAGLKKSLKNFNAKDAKDANKTGVNP